MRRLLVVVLIFLSAPAALAQYGTFPCPANIDFSFGNFNNWNCFVGLSNCGGSCANPSGNVPVFGNSLATLPLPGRHVITSSPATDAYGGFPVVAAGGGTNSLRLGKDSAGYRSERIRYTIHVPIGYNDYALRFKYAAVLNNAAAHAAYMQPALTIRGIDSATGNTVACADLSYNAGSNGFLTSSVNSNVRYLPWTDGNLNLSGQSGRTTFLEVTVLSCGDGSHWAYAYFDVIDCGRFVATFSYCDMRNRILLIDAPAGYANYKWYKGPVISGAPLSSASYRTINVPITDTLDFYYCIITPFGGNGCYDTVRSPAHRNFYFHMQPDSRCNDIIPLKYVWYTVDPPTNLTVSVFTPLMLTPIFGDPLHRASVGPFTGSPFIRGVATDSFGCFQQDTVMPRPRIFTLATIADTITCPGIPVRLSPSLMPANLVYTFRWKGTNATAVLDDTSLRNPLYSPLKPGSDTLALYVNAQGCETFDSMRITTLDTAIFATGDTVCQYALAMPKITGDTNFLYTWYPLTGIDSADAHSQMPSVASDTTRSYTITASHAGCPTITKTVTIAVEPQPRLVLADTLFKCPDAPSIINALTEPAGYAPYRFLWSYNSGIVDLESSQTAFNGAADTVLYLTVTTTLGCTGSDSIAVHVYPKPGLALRHLDSLYAGQQYQINPMTDGKTFMWTPATFLSDSTIQNPVTSPTVSIRYTLTTSNEFGCLATDSIELRIIEDESVIEVPNAFSPGISLNSILRVLTTGPVGLHYFRIYNRWGALVFETSNPGEGWDGSYHGYAQPQGIYLYALEAATNRGHMVKKSGNVLLIR